MTKEQKELNRMIRYIAKKVLKETDFISEDMANQLAYELTNKNKNPNDWDLFMEACGTVENAIKKALKPLTRGNK